MKINALDLIKQFREKNKNVGGEKKITTFGKKDNKLKLGVEQSLETINEEIENKDGKVVYKLSFSEYTTFRKCPHKWFLTYMLKFPSDKSEEMIFGTSVHDTIESILTNKNLRQMVSNNSQLIGGIYANVLKEEISKIKDIEFLKKMQNSWVYPTFYKQGTSLLKELNIFNRFKDYDVVDVEFQLDDTVVTETSEFIITYKGFIDLVLKHKITGRYLILDWKTSKSKWKIKEKEKDPNFYDQLYLYRFFYSKKKNIPLDQIDLCFYNLPREAPKEMDFYFKEATVNEILEFVKNFKKNCEKMINFNIFALDKEKHLTKKNFCSRCSFNNEEQCNDVDQFQVVNLK